MNTRLITLTTDFGLSDNFVGTMKGAILSVNSKVTIVDLTHDIFPQDIQSASFSLYTAIPHFPPKTIHIAVVDPGVGSTRRPIIVETEKCFFVGPDNGIFSPFLDDGKTTRIFQISNPDFLAPARLRSTFDGRDVFAPCAGYLSQGVAPDQFGDEIKDPNKGLWPAPGEGQGVILHIDRFGNLISNLLPNDAKKQFELDGAVVKLVESYSHGDSNMLSALVGSHGFIEIFVKNGSAQSLSGALRGETVKVL